MLAGVGQDQQGMRGLAGPPMMCGDMSVTLVDTLPTLFHQLFGTPRVDQPDTQDRAGAGGEWDFVPVPDPEAAPSP